MSRVASLEHRFVEFIPAAIDGGVLYISLVYATATHLCCCGCGNKVVTPITPTDWRLVFDGESVTLDPSIGNWSFKCESHYWIVRGKIRWAPKWSRERIENGRRFDSEAKETYFRRKSEGEECDPPERRESLLKRLSDWWD